MSPIKPRLKGKCPYCLRPLDFETIEGFEYFCWWCNLKLEDELM